MEKDDRSENNTSSDCLHLPKAGCRKYIHRNCRQHILVLIPLLLTKTADSFNKRIIDINHRMKELLTTIQVPCYEILGVLGDSKTDISYNSIFHLLHCSSIYAEWIVIHKYVIEYGLFAIS